MNIDKDVLILIEEIKSMVETHKKILRPLWINNLKLTPEEYKQYETTYALFLVGKNGNSIDWVVNPNVFAKMIGKICFEKNLNVSFDEKFLVMEKFKNETMLAVASYSKKTGVEINEDWFKKTFSQEKFVAPQKKTAYYLPPFNKMVTIKIF